MGRLAGFGRFWWRFVVGDDPRIAAGVLVVLVVAAVAAAGGVAGGMVAVGVGIAVIALAFWNIARDAQPPGGG